MNTADCFSMLPEIETPQPLDGMETMAAQPESINGTTRVCAVMGDPVGHSLSPAMHNAAFQALGLNYVYVAFHVPNRPESVKMAMDGMRGFQLRGLSVTIPHKLAVMTYLDEIDPLAQRIGAVNTITNNAGRLLGTNTDAYGTLMAIETMESIDEKNVVLLGTGGAARAAAFALVCERRPARLVIAGRNADKTQQLANEVGRHSTISVSAFPLEPANSHDESNRLRALFEQAGIIVHTTPIGMYPNTDECLIEEELFCQQHVVFDMIYNPAETQLLRRARQRGARSINGVPMFVYQGAEQFRLWTGHAPPIEVMHNAVEKALGDR